MSLSSFSIVLMCLLITIYSSAVNKNVYNPLTLFSIIWAGIVFLNGLNLYGLSEISRTSWNLVFIAVLSFAVSYAVFSRFVGRKKVRMVGLNVSDAFVSKIYLVISVLCVMYLVYKFFIFLRMLSSGYSYSYIRMAYGHASEEGELGLSVGEYMFRMYLMEPFIYLNEVVFALLLMQPQKLSKYGKRVLFLSLVVVLLQTITTGGRSAILIIVFLLGESFLIFNLTVKIRKISMKTMFIVALTIVLGVVVLIISTKRVLNFDLIRAVYVYLGTSLHLMDLQLTIFNSAPTYTYGLVLLMGIIRLPITLLYKVLNIGAYPELYDYACNVGSNLQRTLRLSSEISLNAFVTPIYYHYVDNGTVGVAIGFMIYAIIMSVYYRRMKQDYCFKTISMYLLATISILLQFIRWQFFRPQYVFAFFMMSFFINGIQSSAFNDERHV